MSTTVEKRELTTIPTANVYVVDGHNPRGEIDTTSEAFDELKASVQEHGVLQPILVGPAGEDGRHPIIAGHRRHAAAVDVGLADIPAMVADLNGGGFSAAIAENLIREDMTPLQEARAIARLRELGMKQVDVAKSLGKSERWARNRQKLLDLPDGLQTLVEAGTLPLEGALHLAPIAAVSPTAAVFVAVEMIKQVETGDRVPAELTDQNQITQTLERLAFDAGLQPISTYKETGVAKLPVSAEARKELKVLHKSIPKHPEPYIKKPGFQFGPADAKKAKSAGVLLEVPVKRWGGTETLQFIADQELVFDLAKKKIPAMKRKAQESIDAYRKRRAGKEPSEAEVVKQEERDERAQKRRAAANKELSERVMALSVPKAAGVDVVRLACAVALGNEHQLQRRLEMAAAAFGKQSESGPSARQTLALLAEAKTAEACLDVFLRTVAVTQYVDVGDSYLPRLGGPRTQELNAELLLDRIAVDADLLPKGERKAAEKRLGKAQAKPKAKRASKPKAKAKAAAKAADGDARADKALAIIKAEPGIGAASLAERMGVKPNYLFRILGDLEKAGLVSKEGRKYTAVDQGSDS
jgi:ParB family chromosome partitioning protein